MDLKIYKKNAGYVFSIIYADTELFCSDDYLPFIGDEGSYPTMQEATSKASLFYWENSDKLTRMADYEDKVSPDEIRTRVINKFNMALTTFLNMIENMKGDSKSGSLKTKINNFKTMIDNYAEIMSNTIAEFEADESVNDAKEGIDILEIGYHDVKSPYSKDTIKLKRKLKKIYKEIRTHFGDFLEANVSGAMMQVMANKDVPWISGALSEMSDDVIERLPFKTSFSGIDRGHTGEYILYFSTDEGPFCIEFDKGLIMTKVQPLGDMISKFPLMSQTYYNNLWYPIFKAISSYKVNDDIIIVPEPPNDGDISVGTQENGDYVKDRFLAFDKRDGTKTKVYVMLKGGESETKLCSFVSFAKTGVEDSIRQSLEKDRMTLQESKLMTCIDSGTKYDGIAGEVIHSGIVERNGYFDVPLKMTYDNEVENIIVLPSYILEKYV